MKTREANDANLEIAELKRKGERDAETMKRLTSEVENLGGELEQEKFARKKIARELSDEKGRSTTLEMSWNKTVVQRDGVQEQLEKMQGEWANTQAALSAKTRTCDDLEDRLATAQRRVETVEHENKNMQESVEKLEKRIFQEQEKRIETQRKLEAEIEVLTREQEILQKERASGLVRLEEMTAEHGKVKSVNSVLATKNEGSVVRIRELELQLKDTLQIKCQLQGQVDTINPEKYDLQQRLRATDMDLQARKDELARVVAENVKLLGQLDAEKASHMERRELLMRAEEDREKALVGR